MKRLITLLVFCQIALLGVAQTKDLTLRQAVLGQWREFRPKTLFGLTWKPGSDSFTWLESGKIMCEDASSGKKKVLITRKRLNALLAEAGIDTVRWMNFRWIDTDMLLISHEPNYTLINISVPRIVRNFKLPDQAQGIDFSPGYTRVAYTLDNNLFVMNEGGEVLQVTNDTDKAIVNGQAVHRNEFGITKGTFWSPDGARLAYYHMDQTMVTDYPLVDITQRVARVKLVKYPMAGMQSHEVTLRVFTLANKQTLTIKTDGPKDHYLTNIRWVPDSRSILIAELNREQNHMRMNRYDAISGKLISTLFEERDSQYVEPQKPARFLGDGSNRFIWESRRDGWNHLYLYSLKGELLSRLTKGKWEVTAVNAVDAKHGIVYYTATRKSPLERHLYAVSFRKGDLGALTVGQGTHSAKLSPNYRYFIDSYSSVSIPNRITLCSSRNGKTVKQLLDAPNPYSDYRVSMPTILSLKASDGTILYGRMIKPYDFDSTRNYPVVVYVYGGPHSQLVRNYWMGGARLWECYLANKGYILFTLDNRGTSYRGSDFEQAIHRRLGTREIADQVVGVNYLKSLPYVDSTRIGVHGWSFGGFMTISLMLRTPELFKVGVAGGPVTDWKFYEVMYGERYMDTPKENPEGYKTADLKRYVKNLKGRLLIIHDDMDQTVVMQHSLTLLHEFIQNGIPVDFFVYPQHPHNVRGADRVHLIGKIIRYFDDNL